MILDNLKAHYSKLVKELLSKNAYNIEAFYLPAYFQNLILMNT